ncbi:hypothetical protein Tco_0865090, partial [Tanacetum coccineum]
MGKSCSGQTLDIAWEGFQKKSREETYIFEEPFEPKSSAPLPVSEIFAIQDPLKKAAKRGVRLLKACYRLGISMTHHGTGLSAASHIERELQITPWNFVAWDLENLLNAMRKKREIMKVEKEDEAAEAAELCRMLME